MKSIRQILVLVFLRPNGNRWIALAVMSATAALRFLPASAIDIYHVFCTNSAAIISRSCVSEDEWRAVTNCVSEFVAVSTNVLEVSSAQLLSAVALYALYEENCDIEALDNCSNICSSILHEQAGRADLWQRGAASAILASVLATDSKYEDAFAACTNAISSFSAEPVSEDDRCLWGATVSSHAVQGLTVNGLLRTYAGLSLQKMNRAEFCLNYTNGLPQQAISIINGCR